MYIKEPWNDPSSGIPDQEEGMMTEVLAVRQDGELWTSQAHKHHSLTDTLGGCFKIPYLDWEHKNQKKHPEIKSQRGR